MISSASLFHFTHDLAALQSIMAEGFRPFYSPENLADLGVPGCPGIPMVSFCDIPLSRAIQHTREYGSYALGFRKEWGMGHNISPIHYIYPGSMCATVIRTIYETLPAETSLRSCTCFIFSPQTAIFFYAKQYEGISTKSGRPVRFYDEREWRYIPFADAPAGPADALVQPILSDDEWHDDAIRTRNTATLHRNYRLRFDADDIRYLIVASEEEVPAVVDAVYGLECSLDDKKKLVARVLAMDQIRADF